MNKKPGSAYPAGISLAAGVGMVLGAAVIFLGHLITWLRDGYWPEYTTSQMFADLDLSRPTVAWVGVQKIIDWTLASPAAAFLLVAGMMIAWAASNELEKHDRRVREWQPPEEVAEDPETPVR